MEESLRLHYLKAMGIDVWLPKQANLAPAGNQTNNAVINTLAEDPYAITSPYALLSWEALSRVTMNIPGCPAAGDCTQYLPGNGNRQADWFLVMDIDANSKALEQEVGQLLTEMLSAMGLRREQIFIAHTKECPSVALNESNAQDASNCKLFLKRQIELVQPKMILALGVVAARNLLQSSASIAELRGINHKLADTIVVVTYHPTYLLSAVQDKRSVWLDLQFAMSTYNHKGH